MDKNPQVLIVDDDRISLTIVESILNKIGLSVVTAKDGQEAIELYIQHCQKIGCIIMDIHMPRMDGIEALRQLRKLYADVRVIMTSGQFSQKNLDMLEPLQPSGFLQKPFDPLKIKKLLGQTLKISIENS